MSSEHPTFTPATARQFDRHSVQNAAMVEEGLACSCKPYVSVFTKRRWAAQGFKVKAGEESIRVPVMKRKRYTDKETGEEKIGRSTRSASLFCRCQVEAGA